MCGIFGMIGNGALANTLHALKLLEYRGYDSVGLALKRGDCLEMYKTVGRVETLSRIVEGVEEADLAIGHTRWATHGSVCTANAHPFLSQSGNFAIVHNGIIDNFSELKQALGVEFSSQTDSETVAHMLDKEFCGDVLSAVCAVAKKLRGSFAIAVMSVFDGRLFAIKNKSPLVVGLSEKGAFLCSDIRCVSHWATNVAVTPDNTVVELSENSARFFRFDGSERNVEFFTAERAEEAEQIEGDFMFKEITEIPSRLRQCKEGYFRSGGLRLSDDVARSLSRIYLVGCGTAFNSGLQAASVARQWMDVDILPVIASEFIYDNYPVDSRTLAFFISQSGETADTVCAAERVNALGGITYAVTNTDNSSLTFQCRNTSNIFAGGEFAVASTKAYNCQLLTLTLLLADIARVRGSISPKRYLSLLSETDKLPDACQQVISDGFAISQLADSVKNCSAVFFIGRRRDYPTACEGSLKLKEISYIHSEAYPAGELKHGTLALIEPTVCVVAVASDEQLRQKLEGSVAEVVSRGAQVVCLSALPFADVQHIRLPAVGEDVSGIVSVVPLQLFAYYVAKRLCRDVDKPRNLAKSVTVE